MKPKQISVVLFGLGILAGSSNLLAKVALDTERGLKFYDTENEYRTFKLSTHLKLDETLFLHNRSLPNQNNPTRRRDLSGPVNSAQIRQAEIALRGGVTQDLSYVFKVDLARKRVEIFEAYLSYKGLAPQTNLLIGKIFLPFSFEMACSSKWLSFLERPLPIIAFAPPLGLGVSLSKAWEMMTATIGIVEYGRDEHLLARTHPISLASRITFSPLHTEDRVYHVGMSLSHQEAKPTDLPRFRSKPEAHSREMPEFLNTGIIRQVKHHQVLGVDAALLRGPFTLQGEYAEAFVNRLHSQSSLRFRGGYIQASFILTGESRNYDFKTGTFGRITPKGDCGAFEIAIRQSYLNLNNQDIRGGTERNLGVSFGWYANDAIRIFGNYIRANIVSHRLDKRKLDIVGVRFQYVY